MDLLTGVLFLAGLVALILGAEALVRGASRLAAAIGISPLVIGLTVVAYGTSAPELAVCVQAAFSGQPDIVLGNVVGSNILNVLFVLGIAALITPLAVSPQLIRLDVPLMIGASILMLILVMDGTVSRLDGVLLLLINIVYVVWTIYQSRKDIPQVQDQYTEKYGTAQSRSASGSVINIFLIVIGLAMLLAGSRWLVNGAVAAAKALGVSELLIGLTIIATGTSLPEVATSIVASVRGQRDIAVGNVIGSNVFNITSVLGLTSIFAPHGIAVSPAARHFDIPVMIAVAVACLPIFFTGHRIARWEGVLFFGYYVAYMLYLILNATGHDELEKFSAVMMEFVIPLTSVTILLLVIRTVRAKHRGGEVEKM
ncbi:calcium/sodium antiporter [candidate division KSB1 bacterium]|nr:calcium/sodium antiporter [candidate division KSB1 bacterium]